MTRALSDVDLSRAVSHALRHQPWRYEIELDEQGWAPVSQLVIALREKGGRWSDVDHGAVERMVSSATKRRYELVGDRIRALYGHSVSGRITKTPAPPPGRLFHGTTPETAKIIAREGLRPMGRQYVHLSVDTPTARAVGSRKTAAPVLLVIDAQGAAEAGVDFYQGNELVWLADHIPARFIAGQATLERPERR